MDSQDGFNYYCLRYPTKMAWMGMVGHKKVTVRNGKRYDPLVVVPSGNIIMLWFNDICCNFYSSVVLVSLWVSLLLSAWKVKKKPIYNANFPHRKTRFILCFTTKLVLLGTNVYQNQGTHKTFGLFEAALNYEVNESSARRKGRSAVRHQMKKRYHLC